MLSEQDYPVPLALALRPHVNPLLPQSSSLQPFEVQYRRREVMAPIVIRTRYTVRKSSTGMKNH